MTGPPLDIFFVMTIAELKRQKRQEMRQRLEPLTPMVKVAHSEKIVARVASLPAFRDADIVLGYVPLSSEPDTVALYDMAFTMGKEVAFPRCHVNGSMEFFKMGPDWRDHLVRGPLPIFEPDPTHSTPMVVAEGLCTLVLVPGLAFTVHRRRLGRGRGYYDRFHSAHRADFTYFGVCFDIQMEAQIPYEAHDMVVDMVVSESAVY
jgi:5-formyltetrahydrofolate cyclo-ligase